VVLVAQTAIRFLITYTLCVYVRVEGYEDTPSGKHVLCKPCIDCYERTSYWNSGCSRVSYIIAFYSRFLARDVIYDVSVRLFVTEVHWRIIANLGFKFRSQFNYRAFRSRCMRARGKGSSPGRVQGSSRATLATARPSCILVVRVVRSVHCVCVCVCVCVCHNFGTNDR